MATLELSLTVDRGAIAALSMSIQSVAAALATLGEGHDIDLDDGGRSIDFQGEPVAHFECSLDTADGAGDGGYFLAVRPGPGIARLVAFAAVKVAPRPLKTEWLGGWPIVSLPAPEAEMPGEAGTGSQ